MSNIPLFWNQIFKGATVELPDQSSIEILTSDDVIQVLDKNTETCHLLPKTDFVPSDLERFVEKAAILLFRRADYGDTLDPTLIASQIEAAGDHNKIWHSDFTKQEIQGFLEMGAKVYFSGSAPMDALITIIHLTEDFGLLVHVWANADSTAKNIRTLLQKGATVFMTFDDNWFEEDILAFLQLNSGSLQIYAENYSDAELQKYSTAGAVIIRKEKT